jgi:tyrosyl-tRNA synthetase
MTTEQKLELITRNAQEVVTNEELEALLEKGGTQRAYVGVEPSGLMHVGQGVILSDKMKDFSAAGFDTIILLADWHAYINDKLGGSMENIQVCADYFVDCFKALGVPDSLRFVKAADLVRFPEYWQDVINVSKSSSVARIKRAMSIMGRKEDEAELDASKLIYPAMQVTDIKRLELTVAYGGMDQRHAHMLYRDLAPKLGWKMVPAVHTPLLTGLQGGGRMDAIEAKMSKSKPESCIFLHDPPEVIAKKISQAFCPPKTIEGNPVAELSRFVLFPRGEKLKVERPAKYGGDVSFSTFDELLNAYSSGSLHPEDLKKATAATLAELLKPVRSYLERYGDNLKRVERMIRR